MTTSANAVISLRFSRTTFSCFKLGLFLTLFLTLLPRNRVGAQDTLDGIVTDIGGEGLPAATITVHDIGAGTMIAWAVADPYGSFSVELPPLDSVRLTIRALGKRQDSLAIALPYLEILRVTLYDGKNLLPETTVRTERAPITERNDTTTVHFRTFRDSTDQKVEEVLRKIPGVEVKETGEIEVYGKPLHRLLIEGSDLFGQDYQLGSKNINAQDIGRVEIIDHYESNPVLRNVNNSDAIVLNLKLEDDVKATLAGNINAGLGYGGREEKYALYATAYRIARMDKTIFIGYLDNIATGYVDVGENFDDSDKGYLLQPLDLYTPPQVAHAGLPRPYTDNTDAAFATLRHEKKLGSWRLNANGSITSSAARQRNRRTESFVRDTGLYAITTLHDWNTTRLSSQGEINLNYLAPDRNTSLDIYGIGSLQSIEAAQRFNFRGETVVTNAELAADNATLSAVFTRALGEQTVSQLTARWGQSNQPVTTRFDFPELGLLTEEKGVRAEYAGRQTRWEVENGWRFRAGRSLWQIGLKGLGLALPEFGTTSQTGRAFGQLNHRLGRQIRLRVGANLGRTSYSTPGNLSGTVYGLSSRITYEPRPTSILTMTGSFEQDFPEALFQVTNLSYLSNPFLITLAAPRPELGQLFRINVSYSKRNHFKLSNWLLRANYTNHSNAPTFTGEFAGPIVINGFRYGLDRLTANTSARYSKFVSALKSDLSIQVATGYSEREISVTGRTTTVSFWERSLRLEGSWLVTQHLRIKGNASLNEQKALQAKVTYRAVGGSLLGIYRFKAGQVFVSYSRINASGGATGRSADGVYFGASHTTKWGKRDVRLNAKVYNPFNRRTYADQYVGDLFLYTNEVPALRRYFIVSADIML